MRTVLMAAALVLAAGQVQGALIHQYRLDGSFADDFGGPNLVGAGGTLGAGGYSFGANQGLSLSGIFSSDAEASTYSIEMYFRFDTVNGFKKILDFKNLTLDSGLYNFNGNLVFFPATALSTGGGLNANVLSRVVLTRNDANSNLVVGYVDGVQRFSFQDDSDLAVSTGTNRIIQFFKDDSATSGGEASAGFVDFIRIYDTALTASEVAALGAPVAPDPVPEPSSLALFSLGFVGFAAARWRKQAG